MHGQRLAPTVGFQLSEPGDLWALQARELQLAAALQAMIETLERVPSNPIRDALLAQCREALRPSAGGLEQLRIAEAERCRNFLADAGYDDAAGELGAFILERVIELNGR